MIKTCLYKMFFNILAVVASITKVAVCDANRSNCKYGEMGNKLSQKYVFRKKELFKVNSHGFKRIYHAILLGIILHKIAVVNLILLGINFAVALYPLTIRRIIHFLGMCSNQL